MPQALGKQYNPAPLSHFDRPMPFGSPVNLPDEFFTAPCLGCVGNLGRNTFVGPGYWAVDTSIFKAFQLSERFSLQFRAEAFSIFNHTNFQLGGATGSTGFNNLNNAQFGQASGTFNPRQLQFGLKLSF